MLAFYSYTQSTLGPLMPFLRAELHLDYATGALHVSAFALGVILAGSNADRVAGRWNRKITFWLGGAGMALGAVLLTLGRTPVFTIASAFVMGYFGTYLLTMIQAALADHHGSKRAIALTESNVAASLSAVIAPLIVGLGTASVLGWRIALLAGAAAWVVMALIFRRTPVPEREHVVQQTAAPAVRRPLPRRFWIFWLVILFGVMLEWSFSFWGADFLHGSVGLDASLASTLMSLFFLAMLVGRAAGSRLTHTTESSRLLIYAIGLVAVGFPLLWLAHIPVINILGLFIAGLGVANLFPLTLAVVTSLVPEQSDVVSARVMQAAGAAVLIAPQVLGSLADRVGLYNAFGVIALILIAAAILIVAGSRAPVPAPAN